MSVPQDPSARRALLLWTLILVGLGTFYGLWGGPGRPAEFGRPAAAPKADAVPSTPAPGAPVPGGQRLRTRRGPLLDDAHLLAGSRLCPAVLQALRQVAQDGGVQLGIWLVADAEPGDAQALWDLTALSFAKAERLALGQRGHNNGLLLTVAPRHRAARLEVGEGLEGVLPDARAAQILRAAFGDAWQVDAHAPPATAGKFAAQDAPHQLGEQVLQATRLIADALAQAAAQGSWVPPTADPEGDAADGAGWVAGLLLLLLLVWWWRGGGGGRGHGLPPFLFVPGGFGGGMGGRGPEDTRGGGGGFGGGGASSRW